MNQIKPIAITPGEPAGIGPDITLTLAQQDLVAPIVVIADPELMSQRASLLGLDINIQKYDANNPPVEHKPGSLWVKSVCLKEQCQPGELSVANVSYVLEAIDVAIAGCLEKQFAAMVTGPIHKGIVNESGIFFSGHTEYLATLAHSDTVVMMLATQGLRVALATTHLPLAEVANNITHNLLINVLTVLQQDLQTKFGIKKPTIFVCGLNPHSGEEGHLGREEIDIIYPAIQSLNQQGFNIVGPLPADTIFSPENIQQADAFLAMYHDQGLPVLKYKGFGQAVNITLGLPFIRTSVDHGTALSLAGTGKANANSLEIAVNYALSMLAHG